MSLSQQIFNFAVDLLQSSGYAGVFLLMAAEGATLPVPSEVVLPFAGYLVSKGVLNFWLVIIVATIGAIVGALIDYSIGYYLGRAAILRYGKYIRLNEKHLKTSEAWFSKHGEIAVLFSKFVPLLRTLISFPAGIAEMKAWKFVLFTAIGASIWNAVLTYAGFVAGQNSNAIGSTLSKYFTPIEILVLVVVIGLIVYLITRRQTKEDEKTSQTQSM